VLVESDDEELEAALLPPSLSGRRHCFGLIRQHFALKRHLLRASLYRKQLGERFVAWHRLTGLAQNPSAF
jgi:hypothetical protein